jgi:hypothetical protein
VYCWLYQAPLVCIRVAPFGSCLVSLGLSQPFNLASTHSHSRKMDHHPSDEVVSTSGSPAPVCDLCSYPDWSDLDPPTSQEDFIRVDSFTELLDSLNDGCTGCILLVNIWRHGAPDASKRDSKAMSFNHWRGNLWVNIIDMKGEEETYGMDVFTLPGALPSIVLHDMILIYR